MRHRLGDVMLCSVRADWFYSLTICTAMPCGQGTASDYECKTSLMYVFTNYVLVIKGEAV